MIYELHVGTFTPDGTFDAAIERLDHLTGLGVDAVELMPVAAFPGERGWGYDGIGLWAVHEPYGGPDGLKRLVDACHARGLAVLLDVVYNHVGIGNRLGDFGPYFTEAHTTPWGPAVNLDQPGSDEVRAFVIEQRADVAARLPPGRAAAGRGARAGRQPGAAPAGGTGRRGCRR